MKDAKEYVKEVLSFEMINNFKLSTLIEKVEARGGIISRVWASEVLNQLGYAFDRSNKVWYRKDLNPKTNGQYVSKSIHEKQITKNLELEKKCEELERKLDFALTTARKEKDLLYETIKSQEEEIKALGQKNEEALANVAFWKNKAVTLSEKYIPKKAPDPKVDPQIRAEWQLKDFENHPDHELAFTLSAMTVNFCNGDLCKGKNSKLCSKYNKCSSHNRFFNKPCNAVENLSDGINLALNKYFDKVGNDWMI